MSTILWATLTVALAALAISGWCLARFFEREALHEHRVALLVGDWLVEEQTKRAKSEAESRKLKRTVAKLRWRVRYPCYSNVADELFNAEFVDEIGEFGKICEPSESVKQYALREWRKDPRNFKKYCDERVFVWEFQRRSRSPWGKYLAREREIRERVGVA